MTSFKFAVALCAAVCGIQQLWAQGPEIATLSLTQRTVVGGAEVSGSVTLSHAVKANVTVTFSSNRPAVAAVPPSVVLQSGAVSASFIVQTFPVAEETTAKDGVEISARAGTSAKSTLLTVLPPSLVDLTIVPSSIGGGKQATGSLLLSGNAPAKGIVVRVSSTLPIRAGLLHVTSPSGNNSAAVLVPAGSKSATFEIETTAVATATSVPVSATLGDVSKRVTLSVLPPALQSLTFAVPPSAAFGTTVPVVSGTQAAGAKVTLTAPAPAEGIEVQIQIPPGTPPCYPPPQAPSTIRIAGTDSATFQLKPSSVSMLTNWPVTVRFGGTSLTRTLKEDVAYVSSLTISPSTAKGGSQIQGIVTLTGPVPPASCTNNHPYEIQFVLDAGNSAYVALPASVPIGAGADRASFTIKTVAVPSTKQIRIYAGTDANSHQPSALLTLTP